MNRQHQPDARFAHHFFPVALRERRGLLTQYADAQHRDRCVDTVEGIWFVVGAGHNQHIAETMLNQEGIVFAQLVLPQFRWNMQGVVDGPNVNGLLRTRRFVSGDIGLAYYQRLSCPQQMQLAFWRLLGPRNVEDRRRAITVAPVFCAKSPESIAWP
jgi:hypothetical protein